MERVALKNGLIEMPVFAVSQEVNLSQLGRKLVVRSGSEYGLESQRQQQSNTVQGTQRVLLHDSSTSLPPSNDA